MRGEERGKQSARQLPRLQPTKTLSTQTVISIRSEVEVNPQTSHLLICGGQVSTFNDMNSQNAAHHGETQKISVCGRKII